MYVRMNDVYYISYIYKAAKQFYWISKKIGLCILKIFPDVVFFTVGLQWYFFCYFSRYDKIVCQRRYIFMCVYACTVCMCYVVEYVPGWRGRAGSSWKAGSTGTGTRTGGGSIMPGIRGRRMAACWRAAATAADMCAATCTDTMFIKHLITNYI